MKTYDFNLELKIKINKNINKYDLQFPEKLHH